MASARALIIGCMSILVLQACSPADSNLALGTLERDRVQLKATSAEVIVELPVAEGSSVHQGDLIVRLDDRRQTAQVARAQANVDAAKANLNKLRHGARAEDIAAARAQVSGAQAVLDETLKNFARAESLVKQKLMRVAELDSARSQRDSAKANLDHANENLLVLTNGTRPEDLEQAEAQVKLAEASLALEAQSLRELNIVATRDGILDHLPKKLGDRTAIGETVAILLSQGAPYARVYVPAPKRVLLKAGQQLNVRVDGVTETFQGQVRWISQDPAFTPYYALNSSDRARLVYLAEVTLPASATELPSGIPAQVELPSE